MTARLKHTLLLLIAFMSLIAMPLAANAASGFVQLSCNANGTVKEGQLFYAEDGGGACEYTGIEHIFSQIICNFVTILNIVLGEVYCGMQYGLSTIISIVITLYVAVFGMQILMGTTQITAKEIVVRLFKIGVVAAFISQSAWGIGFAFRFFVGLITQGSVWALAGSPLAMAPTSSDVMPAYAFIDNIIYSSVTGPFNDDNAKILGLFAAMAVALPPLFMMALYWLWITVTLLTRTLVSFMLSVSAVAFLISLSPIFLSFMLFQFTFHFFETWLRYMISFCLQIIVVFAIVGMWFTIMSHFIDFFSYLSKVTFYWGDIPKTGAMLDPHKVWGICPFSLGADGYGNPQLVCNNASFNPKNNPNDRNEAIKPAQFAQFPEFVYIVVYNLMTLILVGYAFNNLMKKAPQIAVAIVGPDSAPMMIAPGWGAGGMGGIMGSPNQSGLFTRRHNSSSTSRAPKTNLLYDKANAGAAADYVSEAASMLRRKQLERK